MKLLKALTTTLPVAALAVATSFLLPGPARAADHGDAPAMAQDQGADVADVFLFMDPAGDGKSDVVLIATFHGFITPGEASNFGVFDPNVRYHFDIYNDHVNRSSPVLVEGPAALKNAFFAKIKPNRTIDVTFSPRAALLSDPSGTPPNNSLPPAAWRPSPQTATVTLGGFPGVRTKVTKNLPTTPPTLGPTAATQITTDIETEAGTIKFFAGIVDDPFFFDIPAFSAFIESIRAGTPNSGVFNRARDTFAGYNCLAIALKFPKSMLLSGGDEFTKIGAAFAAQRHVNAINSSQGSKGVGAYKTIDRMGNPGVNVALVPFNLKNAYNGGTPKDDASLKFAGASGGNVGIADVLEVLGATPDKPAFGVLANIAIAWGDILILDTNIANTGPNGGTNTQTGFGVFASSGQPIGGRRLMDDTIDAILGVLAPGLKDNVGQEPGFFPANDFPFLHTPHQPLANGVIDDGTRN